MVSGSGRISTCHPERKHRAHGLCNECYMKQYAKSKRTQPTRAYRQTATCHPDRPHKARGLCNECYRDQPDRKAYEKQYAKANSRRDQLKHRYGITPEEYNQMFYAQQGLCAICGQPPRGKTCALFVDHDHTTGKVRGLLCITCNRHLGWHENKEWRQNADDYLSKYEA